VVEQNGAYSAKSMLAGMLDVGGDDGKEEAMARGAIETKKACGREEWRVQCRARSPACSTLVVMMGRNRDA